MNQCLHAYTGIKIPDFCAAILYVPKQLKWALSRAVCDKATAQMAQFRAMGIVSGPSRYPKDVPFVSFGGGRTVWAL